MNEEKRKILILENNSLEGGIDHWIEGIGSINGLRRNLSGICYLDGYSTSISCYYENREKVYQPHDRSCFIVNTQNFHKLQQIILFPNPTIDHLQLDLSKISIPNLQIHISSILGQQVKAIQATIGLTQQIEVRNLVSGLYFLSLEKDGQVLWSERFVKKE